MSKKKDKKDQRITAVVLWKDHYFDVRIKMKNGLQFIGTPDQTQTLQALAIKNDAVFSDTLLDVMAMFANLTPSHGSEIYTLDDAGHGFERSDGLLTVYTVAVQINGKWKPAYAKKSGKAISYMIEREREAQARLMADAEAAETQALHDAGFVTGDAAFDPPISGVGAHSQDSSFGP